MTENEAVQKICHLTLARATYPRTCCVASACMAWRDNDCALIAFRAYEARAGDQAVRFTGLKVMPSAAGPTDNDDAFALARAKRILPLLPALNAAVEAKDAAKLIEVANTIFDADQDAMAAAEGDK